MTRWGHTVRFLPHPTTAYPGRRTIKRNALESQRLKPIFYAFGTNKFVPRSLQRLMLPARR